MVAYRTGSNPIEIGDLGSKVKVTVTETVCKNDEKIRQKFESRYLLNQISSFDRKLYYRHFDNKFYHIAK